MTKDLTDALMAFLESEKATGSLLRRLTSFRMTGRRKGEDKARPKDGLSPRLPIPPAFFEKEAPNHKK